MAFVEPQFKSGIVTIILTPEREVDSVQGCGFVPLESVADRNWRWNAAATTAVLALSDVAALIIAASLALALRLSWDFTLRTDSFLGLWPLLGLFLLAYRAFRVLPVVGFSNEEELRRLSIATTLVFLVVTVMFFLLKESAKYSRLLISLTWFFALFAVPLLRVLTYRLFAHRFWWGFPAAIIGPERSAAQLVETLHRFPRLGLRPLFWTIYFNDDLDQTKFNRDKASHSLKAFGDVCREIGAQHLVVVMPDRRDNGFPPQLERVCQHFRNVIVVPSLPGLTPAPFFIRHFGSTFGFDVQNRLLRPELRIIKRTADLVLALLIGLCISPLFACLALRVRATSRGPIFYPQPRIGRRGKKFKMWKFRTMVENAELSLERYLQENKSARDEWTDGFKLKSDPRVTPLGKMLRASSLDELPQLWNVIRGEMSLVGPRPIMVEEIDRYGGQVDSYMSVTPGMTGLWQVSGRNNALYEERIAFNRYYVANWSLWLDMVILVKTLPVVLGKGGAY